MEIEASKLDRVDRNPVNISVLNDNVLYQLLYQETEIELEIVSLVSKGDRITLNGISKKEIIIPHVEYLHDLIFSDYDLLLTKIVFSMSMDEIDDRDLDFLKSDSRFTDKLTELNSTFLKKYSLIID